MFGNCISSWKTVTYAKDNVSVPAERWGHRFVRVSEH